MQKNGKFQGVYGKFDWKSREWFSRKSIFTTGRVQFLSRKSQSGWYSLCYFKTIFKCKLFHLFSVWRYNTRYHPFFYSSPFSWIKMKLNIKKWNISYAQNFIIYFLFFDYLFSSTNFNVFSVSRDCLHAIIIVIFKKYIHSFFFISMTFISTIVIYLKKICI